MPRLQAFIPLHRLTTACLHQGTTMVFLCLQNTLHQPEAAMDTLTKDHMIDQLMNFCGERVSVLGIEIVRITVIVTDAEKTEKCVCCRLNHSAVLNFPMFLLIMHLFFIP